MSAEYNHQRRQRLKSEERCPNCGQPNSDPDHMICPGCRAKATASARRYRQNHPTQEKERRARYVTEGQCVSCGRPNDNAASGKVSCSRCLDRKQRYDAGRYKQGMANHQQLKREIFDAYGGAECICCGEQQIEFLTLDHILGGGRAHRRSLSGSATGPHLYRKLKKVGFPNDPPLQVMCLNCNFAKGHGGCPHEVSRRRRSS